MAGYFFRKIAKKGIIFEHLIFVGDHFFFIDHTCFVKVVKSSFKAKFSLAIFQLRVVFNIRSNEFF